MVLTAEKIFAFLEEDVGVDVSDLNSSTLLFSEGLIDSFALINVITFIESETNIRISPGDVNLDNLDSIDRILAYVERALA